MSSALCTHINTITIKEHWERKQRYKTGNAMMVNFNMAGRAIRGLPKAQQRWVAKSVAQFLLYGTNMKRWKLRQEDRCPRCQQQAESKAHHTQCQATEAINTWTTVINQLEQWLISAHTAPDI